MRLAGKFIDNLNILLIEDRDIEYVQAIASFAEKHHLTLKTFEYPLHALNFLYRTKVKPDFILVDYFLPEMSGDIFIKRALDLVSSKFILYSISADHLFKSVGTIPMYGLIKKKGIEHFKRTLEFYILQDKQPRIHLYQDYVLLKDIHVLYYKKDPNKFIVLTKAETRFLSTFKPVDNIYAIRGLFSNIVSVSTVMRLNKKLQANNIPFKIQVKYSGFLLKEVDL